LPYGVFASRWPLEEGTVWTIVNRNEYDVSGPQVELRAQEGMHYFDLWHGVELTPGRGGDKIVLTFDINAKDYGALFAAKSAPDATIQNLMTRMKVMTARPLARLRRMPKLFGRWSILYLNSN